MGPVWIQLDEGTNDMGPDLESSLRDPEPINTKAKMVIQNDRGLSFVIWVMVSVTVPSSHQIHKKK